MNTDWNHVKNTWPKSYLKFIEHGGYDEYMLFDYDIYYCNIVNFFDDNGIIIELCLEDVEERLSCSCCYDHSHYSNRFFFSIYVEFENDKYRLCYGDNMCYLRQETQTRAVYKAMEIMERQIKNGKIIVRQEKKI